MFQMNLCAQVIPVGVMYKTNQGNNLQVVTKGQGKYTFIFSGGFGSPSTYTDFKSLADELAKENKVMLIDRIGIGFSNEAPKNFRLEETVEQLREILKSNDSKGPYIYIAHSSGALEALHFASRYNEDMAGIILIDGASPQTYQNFMPEKPIKFLKKVNKNRWLFKTALNLGLVSEWNKRKKLLPKDIVSLDKQLLIKNFANSTMIETVYGLKDFAQLVKEEINISQVPLLILTASSSFNPKLFYYTNWEADQTYLVGLSKQSKQIFLDGSHSTIHLSNRNEILGYIKQFLLSLN